MPWRTLLRNPIAWTAVLILGLSLLVLGLLGLLDLARYEDGYTGEEFTRAAAGLRGMAAVEVLLVVVSSVVVRVACRTWLRRLVALAIVVWTLGLLDIAFIAQAGVIPR